MSFQPIQDANLPQRVVGASMKGKLPGPAVVPMQYNQPDKPMSDLQRMLLDEQKQHEQHYVYKKGHN